MPKPNLFFVNKSVRMFAQAFHVNDPSAESYNLCGGLDWGDFACMKRIRFLDSRGNFTTPFYRKGIEKYISEDNPFPYSGLIEERLPGIVEACQSGKGRLFIYLPGKIYPSEILIQDSPMGYPVPVLSKEDFSVAAPLVEVDEEAVRKKAGFGFKKKELEYALSQANAINKKNQEIRRLLRDNKRKMSAGECIKEIAHQDFVEKEYHLDNGMQNLDSVYGQSFNGRNMLSPGFGKYIDAFCEKTFDFADRNEIDFVDEYNTHGREFTHAELLSLGLLALGSEKGAGSYRLEGPRGYYCNAGMALPVLTQNFTMEKGRQEEDEEAILAVIRVRSLVQYALDAYNRNDISPMAYFVRDGLQNFLLLAGDCSKGMSTDQRCMIRCCALIFRFLEDHEDIVQKALDEGMDPDILEEKISFEFMDEVADAGIRARENIMPIREKGSAAFPDSETINSNMTDFITMLLLSKIMISDANAQANENVERYFMLHSNDPMASLRFTENTVAVGLSYTLKRLAKDGLLGQIKEYISGHPLLTRMVDSVESEEDLYRLVTLETAKPLMERIYSELMNTESPINMKK